MLTSAGCPLVVALGQRSDPLQPGASKGTLGIEKCVTEILGRQKNGVGNLPICFKGKQARQNSLRQTSLIQKFSRGDTPDPR